MKIAVAAMGSEVPDILDIVRILSFLIQRTARSQPKIPSPIRAIVPAFCQISWLITALR